MSEKIIYNIAFVGNSVVGKTNIFGRLLGKEFNKESGPTLTTIFANKSIELKGRSIVAYLQDTPGIETYRSIIKLYYKAADGVFVVYDITDKSSFDDVDYFIENIKNNNNKNASIIIIGNKCDLKKKRQITVEQGKSKAKKYGVDFIETSALSGENIEKAFEIMIKKVAKIDMEENNSQEKEEDNEEKEKLSIENKKLKDELNKFKNNYEKLKQDYDKLNNELNKAKKIISNIDNSKLNENQNNNEIINLKNLILQKDNEILNLKTKLQNMESNNKKSVNYDDILYVHFISSDQKINCPIKCLKTDTFAEVEEKLYQRYEEYRETNNNFLAKGRLVLRFKKIFENKITDGDKVELICLE